MTLETVGNIIGGIAVCEGLLIYLAAKRDRILFFKFISDILWTLNHLFLSAYTGAVLCGTGIFREIVFYNRDRRKWASYRIWLYVFLVLTLISPILEWTKNGFSFIPILPAVGSMVAVVSFYTRNPRLTQWLALIVHTLWGLYAILIANYPSFLSNIIALISAIIGITKVLVSDRHEKKIRTKE